MGPRKPPTSPFFFFVFFLYLQTYCRFAFGPQHPASHGVLTLIIYMFNEVIRFNDIHIGYLHRGTEKLCEFKSIELIIPYLDRLDYVSVCYNEHMFTLAFEFLLHFLILLVVAVCIVPIFVYPVFLMIYLLVYLILFCLFYLLVYFYLIYMIYFVLITVFFICVYVVFPFC